MSDKKKRNIAIMLLSGLVVAGVALTAYPYIWNKHWIAPPPPGEALIMVTYSNADYKDANHLFEAIQELAKEHEKIDSGSVKGAWNRNSLLLPGFKFKRIIRVTFVPKEAIDTTQLRELVTKLLDSSMSQTGTIIDADVDVQYDK